MPEIQPPTSVAAQPSTPVSFHAEPNYLVLKDAWPTAKPFALNGWFERHSFAPWLAVLLVVISAFLLLNLIGAVVLAMAAIPAAMESGGQISPEELLAKILEDAGVLLGANALALVFGMGLVALLAARLSSRDWKGFLRIRRPDLPVLGLAAVGWVVLLPVWVWTWTMTHFRGFTQRTRSVLVSDRENEFSRTPFAHLLNPKINPMRRSGIVNLQERYRKCIVYFASASFPYHREAKLQAGTFYDRKSWTGKAVPDPQDKRAFLARGHGA
ncbi:MAG: hypothetical protein IIC85_09620 [Chloroflexi bacterium]|nr:hypothetical protein [Chloroflexota bacterium]